MWMHYGVAEGVYKEIAITREDTLKSLEDYLLQLPPPNDTIRETNVP